MASRLSTVATSVELEASRPDVGSSRNSSEQCDTCVPSGHCARTIAHQLDANADALALAARQAAPLDVADQLILHVLQPQHLKDVGDQLRRVEMRAMS
jgi:hypothetical protein